ncbi:phage tail tape measure protein [Streptomyces scabiei]|uniref:phage tail tape measure protein n=1 Tax=Streptomyces scabiei TaxID=1930 RepID=UPI0029B81A43|nr:phage tail tape measure protein [Streptomyces scabiei]MDX2658358.1 phage tail tape measure protein [Streptomyces scabiei]MDX2870514.1 phage tail tape measure protein [Streptomyces scabiei]
MANWNLSVDLRGHGNDLAQALKSSAKHARRLATAARDAKNDVKELGQASQTASRHVRSLGSEARTTARRLTALGDGAQNAARRLGRYGDAAQRANRHVNSLGDNSRTTGRQLARMSGQIDTAVRDLLRLAQAAQRADARLNRVGGSTRGMRRYADETGRARRELMSVANLLTGGAFAIGGAELLKMGGEYQQAMNTFGAVTGATAMQMQRAAATADQLGNDLSLPAASATDAAEAMVELAKAGFRTDQAISATRASLQLAAAAQINAADSAKYLGDMMDQFGMGADQASVAADTLAATANAASGDIIDIYYAMKYAGPVAHGLGVTMQEAASAVGMLGKAGILGQTAGTTLRGMMANLAAPTPQMIEGLKAMGIEAWDAQGNFKGLRHVIDGLSKAQHHMTQQDFAAAVKKSMGKPAMSGAIALAHQGVDSFDALMSAVSDTGAASDIAAAKGKGLAGAMLQLKTQAKQTGLTIYDGLAPGLEFLTRGTTSLLARATPKIKQFFDYFNDAATLFGPDLAAAAREELAGIADAAADLAGPFKDLGTDALAALLHILITGGTLAAEVLSALAEGAEPVVDALSGLTGEGNTAATTLDLVVTVLDLAATAAGALAGALGPLGHLVGGLVSMFAALPGPIQQFVLAALLVRRLQPGMAGLASTVSGRVTGAFRSLNQQMAVQRSLAAASGMTISRYGAAFAVLQTRVPVIGRMGAAFRTAQSHATGFAGTLRGIGAASASAARSMGSGLMGALGGPWGLAITAATVGLGVLASRQQQAAAAAAEHQNQIQSLSQALRESNGVVDESVRAIATENLMNTKVKTTLDGQQRLVDLARKAKVPMSDLVDAYTNQGTSLSRLQRELKATAAAQTTIAMDPETGQSGKALTVQGRAATDLRKSLGGLSGDFKKAAADARDYNNGVKGAGDGVSAYSRLKDAVGALADKTADADSRTRALRDALDLLSGGSVSLQAAQARVNEAVTNATEAMQGGIDKADGWGKALLKTNGQLDTTSKNGQALFNTLNTISDGSASASIAAFDFAQSQGKSLPDSLKAARSEMEKNRAAAIGLAKDYGLNAEQAARVADSMGLIPGQVSILLQTQGVDQTLAELLAVQAEFEQTPDSKTIKVDALGDEAKKELEDLGYKIKLIPGTREYKITAPTDEARRQLDLLIGKLGSTNGKNIKVDADVQETIADLEAVKKKVASTKGKTITMRAPTAAAREELEALGFKIRNTKGKNVVITVPTGSQRAGVDGLRGAINSLRDRSITVTTRHVTINETVNKTAGSLADALRKQARNARKNADGGVFDYFNDGGIQRGGIQHFAKGSENHVAQIAPGGSWRVWAEDETQGEGYVPFARSKRPRSRAITEEIVRRLGGDPAGIQWNADGSVTDWRYDPQTGSLYSSSDAGAAGHKTKKVKIKGKVKEIEYFDVGAVEKKLKSAGKATQAWNKDLEKVADRVGGDVAEALAAMGKDGVKLADKMAKGSTKYINQMAKALRDLQKTAKASLTDYTRQLDKANKLDKTFSDNLAKLAAQGYGDLAAQLAEQNDEAAMDLAAAAVKDKGKAGKANKAAKTANNALTADQVSQLVSIIAGIKNSKTGIHDVAATTGLGEDDIIAVATKATKQIKSALGSRAGRFLADLAKAQKGMAYENGGIRAGMYATQAGIIRFAEPSTHGEAYVPFAPSKRGAATSVLADVAGRFGYGLTPASGAGGQVVIIREKAPLVGSQTWHVTSGGSADDTARKVDANNSYQLRRLARGGVGARG